MQQAINDIRERLDLIEKHIGIRGGGSTPALSTVTVSPSIRAFEAYMAEHIPSFLSHCTALGGGAADGGQLIQQAWKSLGEFLALAAACKKPGNEIISSKLVWLHEAMKNSSQIVSGPWENHQKAVKEAVESLQWVLIELAPADYVDSSVGGSDFWTNKIRVQYKGIEAQQGFCSGLKGLLQGLVQYVKEYHTTGVAWNPRGVDVSEYTPGAAVPATSIPETSRPAQAAFAQVSGVPRALAAYDNLTSQLIEPFKAAARALEGASSCAETIDLFWKAQREIIEMACACKKPDQQIRMSKMGSIQNAARQADLAIVRGDFENHQKAVKEVVAAASWLMMEPAPVEFVKEQVGSSDFWANKVRVAQKGNALQVAFCDCLKAVIMGLIEYIREHHLTGLTWNPQGEDVENFTPGSASAAPKTGANLFAELSSKGDGVTAGLKKVTRDMQTWRKDYKPDESKPVPVPSSRSPAVAPSKPVAAVARTPLVQFQDRGNKWVVEHQTKEQGIVEINVENIMHSVYIYNCNDAIINITGKAKGISIDGCKKTKVLLDNTVSSLEFVNCQRMQSQIRGKVPSIAIDKTDGILIYLSKDSLDSTFTTSKSSEMNISFPNENDDMVEIPIPEQFIHKVVLGATPTITSDVSELYSS